MIDSQEAPIKSPDTHSNIDEDTSPLLAAIIDSSEDAIISRDLNGIITSWNNAARRMYGYTAEEIVGQSILRLVPDELRFEENEILRKLRAGERLEHFETTRLSKSGQRIEVSLTISPIKDSAGRVIGISKIARDISARKQMERSLVQSEKLAAAGRMAATVAHEINNPLEAVLNLMFLARSSCPPGSETDGYLETAEAELERVSHIARQALGFYRDTGRPTEIVVDELLKNVLAVYRSKLKFRNIALRCQFTALHPLKAAVESCCRCSQTSSPTPSTRWSREGRFTSKHGKWRMLERRAYRFWSGMKAAELKRNTWHGSSNRSSPPRSGTARASACGWQNSWSKSTMAGSRSPAALKPDTAARRYRFSFHL